MHRPIVLIIPTRNEAAAIGAALAAVPRNIVDRIIVVDGSSTDSTAELALAAGAEVIDAGRGYGRACWLGALAATDDAILVFMDGDGSDDPDCIARLSAPIQAGAQDFVIASRVRGQRERGSMGRHQILIGIVMGWLIKILYGVRYTDMCAFRAIGRERLLALGMREMTYGWNLEMQMRAAQRRLRILELAVPYRRRAGGESKVAGSFIGTLTASRNLLGTFLRIASSR